MTKIRTWNSWISSIAPQSRGGVLALVQAGRESITEWTHRVMSSFFDQALYWPWTGRSGTHSTWGKPAAEGVPVARWAWGAWFGHTVHQVIQTVPGRTLGIRLTLLPLPLLVRNQQYFNIVPFRVLLGRWMLFIIWDIFERQRQSMGHFISFQMWSFRKPDMWIHCNYWGLSKPLHISLPVQYPLGYHSLSSIAVQCGGMQRLWVRILGCERRVFFEKVF